jgi:hypothetical protein
MDNVLVQERIFRHDFITGKGKSYNVYRGVKSLETGYIYTPYVPMFLEPTFNTPNNFQPTQEIQTRYTTTTLNNRYYGTISVSDFDVMGDD